MIVWHYTTGLYFNRIVETKVLWPAPLRGDEGKGSRPVVWFSSCRDFDPTARRSAFDPVAGHLRMMTVEEMARECGGCYRFGVDRNVVSHWDVLREKAKIKPKYAKKLIGIGKKEGVSPEDWYGTIQPVTCNKWRRVEKWVDGQWEPMEDLIAYLEGEEPPGERELERMLDREGQYYNR